MILEFCEKLFKDHLADICYINDKQTARKAKHISLAIK